MKIEIYKSDKFGKRQYIENIKGINNALEFILQFPVNQYDVYYYRINDKNYYSDGSGNFRNTGYKNINNENMVKIYERAKLTMLENCNTFKSIKTELKNRGIK